MIDATLGSIHGRIDGNVITIHHSHLAELVLWLGDAMIDWTKPVRVIANDKLVFDGLVRRDVRVALSQAFRTRDFDRIRWAGLVIDNQGNARLFDPDAEKLPEVVWEQPR
jgi:hypothetical protein